MATKKLKDLPIDGATPAEGSSKANDLTPQVCETYYSKIDYEQEITPESYYNMFDDDTKEHDATMHNARMSICDLLLRMSVVCLDHLCN